MARARTTKKVAQRIDLNYFKRPTTFKRARTWLTLGAAVLALMWIAWRGVSKDSRVYSSGRLSEAHAVIEKRCEVCHLVQAGAFSSKATDAACLACHDGPRHQAREIAADVPTCATCHMEHRGRVDIRAASNRSCAECHANLRVTSGAPNVAAHISSLEDGHPEMAALRTGAKDAGTIKLNHAIHLKPIRRGPNGPIVQLECGDCHRAAVVQAEWKYGDAAYESVKPTYAAASGAAMQPAAYREARPGTGRERMAAPEFATACAGCHLLTFDKLFEFGVPHDKTDVVHAFVVKTYLDYVAAHPAVVRVAKDPDRDLSGKPVQPAIRVLTASQWVEEKTAKAEDLLWRKTCKQCHTLTMGTGNALPGIAPANQRLRWMPAARFDHDAHRGFACANCHATAATSQETSDVLVPGIATCKECHAPGPQFAESRCFECHTYHDWSKRKEVHPRVVLTGGGK